MKNLIFHELLHNSGHDHSFTQGVDRVYACAECCFSSDQHETFKKQAACRVCSEERPSIQDMSFVYREAGNGFEMQFRLSNLFQRPTKENWHEVAQSANPNLVVFANALEEILIAEKLLDRPTLFRQDEEQIKRARPLARALINTVNGNYSAAAEGIIRFLPQDINILCPDSLFEERCKDMIKRIRIQTARELYSKLASSNRSKDQLLTQQLGRLLQEYLEN